MARAFSVNHGPIRPLPRGRDFVINVASNRNGVGYGKWTHIDGWSEAVVEYIAELEAAGGNAAM